MPATEKVRKQFVLDPVKIEMVRRLTRAKTDTEAINLALDMVIADEKIERTLKAVKGKGSIRDVYGRVTG